MSRVFLFITATLFCLSASAKCPFGQIICTIDNVPIPFAYQMGGAFCQNDEGPFSLSSRLEECIRQNGDASSIVQPQSSFQTLMQVFKSTADALDSTTKAAAAAAALAKQSV